MCVFVCSMLMISEEWQVSSPGGITSSWCKVGSCIWIIQPASMQAELQLWCSQIEMCSQTIDYVIQTVRVLLLCQEHGTSMFADRNEFSHHRPLYENVRAFYFALWCSQIVMSSYTKKHFNKLRGPFAFAFYFKDGFIFTRYMNLTSDRNYTINASLTQATMPSTVPTKRA